MTDLSPLERFTLLLLFAPSPGRRVKDPIPGKTHLAKELFLLWKNPVFQSEFPTVRFEPGRFGPWTDAIAVSVDELTSRDLVIVSSGRTQSLALTDKGNRVAASLWETTPAHQRAVLTDVKSNLNPLTTDDLLERIYQAFPEFAAESEWKGRRS